MKKFLIIPFMAYIILCYVSCLDSAHIDKKTKMKDVFVENSSFIEEIIVYQNGLYEIIPVDDLSSDVEETFGLLIGKQKRIGSIDGGLELSIEDVEQILMGNEIVLNAELIDKNNTYFFVELVNTCSFSFAYGYTITCDMVLIDVEGELIHWGKQGKFVGSLSY